MIKIELIKKPAMESIMNFWGGIPLSGPTTSEEAMLHDFLGEETFSGVPAANSNQEGGAQETQTPTATTPTITVKPEDSLREYQLAKEHLMGVEFGLANNNKVYVPQSKLGWDYISARSIINSEDSEVSTTPLPAEYQQICHIPDENFPFNMTITDLPTFSRVETQIKINLQISPAPSEFLVHLPRDTIAKPKFTLKSPDLPSNIIDHILYLDTFVVSSESESSTVIKSCNACKRCMRREMKRASRKKKGLEDDSSNWDLKIPKRAIIFNAKEIVSFPPPKVNGMDCKNLELLSRIVCYCRHHQETNGFRLLFVLKNGQNQIVGKCYSDPIMIMDRKKAIKTIDSTIPMSQYQSQSQLSDASTSAAGSSTTVPTTARQTSSSINLLNDHSTDFSNVNSFVANNSQNALDMLLNQSIMGGDDMMRPTKRQKRPWSPPANDNYSSNVNIQRHSSTLSLDPNEINIKKDANSPLTSDANSPHNQHMLSSATSNSILENTPEKLLFDNQFQITSNPTNQFMQAPVSDLPMVQRIIPAQGPIRGGIEITLLGTNFHSGLQVKFGANLALATQCWSDTTMVSYLPPASQPGPVLVTFENVNSEVINPNAHQIFTYTDDTDRQLIELALQIVGLKMNGKLEDAKNIAKRIVGTNTTDLSPNGSPLGANNGDAIQSTQEQQQQHINWMTTASKQMKELSKTNLNHETILMKFLGIVNLPNSPINTPNWGVCNSEGQTMLHLASFMKYDKLCGYLLRQGSKVDAIDKNGLTPIHFAFLKGHRGIIDLLFKYGSKVKKEELVKISDSNVLDLLNSRSRRISIDSNLSSDYDDDVDDVIVGAAVAVDHVDMGRIRSSGESEDDNSDIQADDEDDEDDEVTATKKDKDANPFGLNLWIAMKAAIVNKMNELGVRNVQEDAMNWFNNTEDDLPSYDDLFPDTGNALRTLMNFRGYDGEGAKDNNNTKDSTLTDDATTTDNETIDHIVVKKPVISDLRLLLFWLPLMMVVFSVVLSVQWELIDFNYAQEQVQEGIERFKTQMGVMIMGQERLGELLNANIAYGRHLLNDVNDAVMTAVGR